MQEKVALWTDASDEFTGYLLTNDKEEVLYDSCAIIPEKRNRAFNQCTNLEEFQDQDTAEKGQGLFCKRQFEEGSFVLEYVGEVRSSQDDGSGGHSAYRMMVNDLTVIDGINSGHPSRFINQSCEPNLECQRWCVGDHTRVGFSAARDIERGAQLTFDYDFKSGGFKCNCGAASCKGWVGKR